MQMAKIGYQRVVNCAQRIPVVVVDTEWVVRPERVTVGAVENLLPGLESAVRVAVYDNCLICQTSYCLICTVTELICYVVSG